MERTLAASQAVLANALRRPTSLTEVPDDSDFTCKDVSYGDVTCEVERIASGNARLSPVEQVDIYREQFWLRHVDVLRDDFSSIEHLLGDDAFEDLAKAYLNTCPSASFTLRDLGEHMAGFVTRTSPWAEDSLLADLARVEWAFVDAFDGPNAPPFDPASIVGVPEEAWPAARIVFHPSLQRVSLLYPAHDYRIAARKKESPVRPEARACHVVVYRGPELLHCLEIDGDACAMLEELAQGTPLGEACERAAAASGTDLETFQGKLAGWFSEWTSIGWIRAVVFATP